MAENVGRDCSQDPRWGTKWQGLVGDIKQSISKPRGTGFVGYIAAASQVGSKKFGHRQFGIPGSGVLLHSCSWGAHPTTGSTPCSSATTKASISNDVPSDNRSRYCELHVHIATSTCTIDHGGTSDTDRCVGDIGNMCHKTRNDCHRHSEYITA